jgi:hypothetical protein
MSNSYFSLLLFIIVTGFYFMVFKKPLPTVQDLNGNGYADYQKKMYNRVLIYFIIVVLTQFGINVSSILSTCGGNVSDSVSSAALLTFIPWVFIFGVLIIMLIMFPGWKSAFSNVVGYFVVSGRANDILSELLVSDANEKIIDATSSSDPTEREKRYAMQEAASAIVKLTGNASLIINQIVPENFVSYWNTLRPLMKEEYTIGDKKGELPAIEQKLLDLVLLRDNIGEAMWYFYAAILLTSIVQYKIAEKGCTPDLATLNANQQAFQEQQQKVTDDNLKAQSKVYAH